MICHGVATEKVKTMRKIEHSHPLEVRVPKGLWVRLPPWAFLSDGEKLRVSSCNVRFHVVSAVSWQFATELPCKFQTKRSKKWEN